MTRPLLTAAVLLLAACGEPYVYDGSSFCTTEPEPDDFSYERGLKLACEFSNDREVGSECLTASGERYTILVGEFGVGAYYFAYDEDDRIVSSCLTSDTYYGSSGSYGSSDSGLAGGSCPTRCSGEWPPPCEATGPRIRCPKD